MICCFHFPSPPTPTPTPPPMLCRGIWGRGSKSMLSRLHFHLPPPPPAKAVSMAVLRLPSHIYLAWPPWGARKRETFYQRKTVLPLLQSRLYCEGCSPASPLLPVDAEEPHLCSYPIPPPLLIPGHPSSGVPMLGSFRCVCVKQGILC